MTPEASRSQTGRVADDSDPEVPERARRRRYSVGYKQRILAEYESLDPADRGALLRREGLYTSLIRAWREQRDQGALAALARPSGRAGDPLEVPHRHEPHPTPSRPRLALQAVGYRLQAHMYPPGSGDWSRT